MDTGKGTFEQLNAEGEAKINELMAQLEAKHPKHGGWFQEGEIVELKGSTFRVKKITPTSIVLRLLKRSE